MEVIYPRCAGLDVHKKTVVACWMHTQTDGHKVQETRTFGTTTGELQGLLAWLQARGWGLLEACVQHLGRPYAGVAGQCPAREAGAGA
jgi:hypothetical protein